MTIIYIDTIFMQTIQELLTRGVREVIDESRLKSRLAGKKKLRVKLGIDPTSTKVHIGRAVVLWKLRIFQELGHKVVFINGDFTGLIGDTSDKESERPMLTEAQVKNNMKTYLKQIGKIVDLNKIEVHNNSKWLKKLKYLEIGKQADQFSLHEFISRDNIARRLNAGKRVSLREVLYPLMQGYDSVVVKADVELGGTDQRFNLLSGRSLQRMYGQEPQDIMTFELLEGTDGRKMSSSWGNVINIIDEPNDMFGKTMAINDALIIRYFMMATKVPLKKVAEYQTALAEGANPRDIKLKLAEEITTLYHGQKAALSARNEFIRVFSEKEKPSDIPSVKVSSKNIVDILVETGLSQSKSEARRLIMQGAVRLNDMPITERDALIDVVSGSVLQAGKRKFVKLAK
jgi:tyrosyl-tRNA synthetase